MLTLRAEPIGATVLITITDDGRGVDADRVRRAAVERGMLSEQAAASLTEAQALDLLFQHGFSTRSEVSELSGRGIGLDVVRSVVEELGGSVTLTSKRGEGTEITLSIPARLSQEKVLVVACGDDALRPAGAPGRRGRAPPRGHHRARLGRRAVPPSRRARCRSTRSRSCSATTATRSRGS